MNLLDQAPHPWNRIPLLESEGIDVNSPLQLKRKIFSALILHQEERDVVTELGAMDVSCPCYSQFKLSSCNKKLMPSVKPADPIWVAKESSEIVGCAKSMGCFWPLIWVDGEEDRNLALKSPQRMYCGLIHLSSRFGLSEGRQHPRLYLKACEAQIGSVL